MTTWLAALWEFVKNRTKEQWLGVVAVVTVLSYALLYFGYFQFYAAFGLRPADVGHDRLRLLQESLLGPLLLPVSLLIHARNWVRLTILILLFLLIAGVFVYCRIHKLDGAATRRELGATALLGVLTAWVILTAYGYVNMVITSRQLGGEVRTQGRLVTSWVYYGPRSVVVPFLDVQAVAVDVTFTAKDAPQPKLTDGCVMYLGSSDGIAVLYDLSTEEVVRVNTADVDLATHPNSDDSPYFGFLPKSCMPASP